MTGWDRGQTPPSTAPRFALPPRALSVKVHQATYYPAPQKTEKKPPESHEVKGQLSDESRRRMGNVLRNWTEAVRMTDKKYCNDNGITVKPSFTFLTLTLASKQIHSDEIIKRKVLNPYLQELIRLSSQSGVIGDLNASEEKLNYLWRAETQKNGNIHFHVMLDRYLPIAPTQALWNRLQDRLGYIERCVIQNPNGADIRAVYNPDDVRKYISKYFSKKDKPGDAPRREITGKIWACNRALLRPLKYSDPCVTNARETVIVNRAYALGLKVIEQTAGKQQIYTICWQSIEDLKKLYADEEEVWMGYLNELHVYRDEALRPVWKHYKFIPKPEPTIVAATGPPPLSFE